MSCKQCYIVFPATLPGKMPRTLGDATPTTPFWKGAVYYGPHVTDDELEECRGKMPFPGAYGLLVVKLKFEIDSLAVEP